MRIRVSDIPPSPAATGLYATRNHVPLVARILLSGLFLWSGVSKIFNFGGTEGYMQAYGMPLTSLFLIAAIAVELGGGLSLLLGYRARLGAIALIVFTLIATLIFHTDLADPMQQIMLMKNLAIVGGLLMVVQHGPGSTAVRW